MSNKRAHKGNEKVSTTYKIQSLAALTSNSCGALCGADISTVLSEGGSARLSQSPERHPVITAQGCGLKNCQVTTSTGTIALQA